MGFSIYPSSHDNSIQIPIGNNTGSLPDLTSVHFPSPLHNPIDQEQDHSSSPYSSVSYSYVIVPLPNIEFAHGQAQGGANLIIVHLCMIAFCSLRLLESSGHSFSGTYDYQI